MTAAVAAAGIWFINYWNKTAEVPYSVEFDESVLGLSAGSPVVFLGVPVGIVDDIYVVAGQNGDGQETFLSHVDILINPEKVVLHEGVTAKLAIYSFATGSLVVFLQGGDKDAPELAPHSRIPVQKSLFESVSSRIEDLLENLNSLIATANAILEKVPPEKVEAIVNDAAGSMEELKQLLGTARDTVDELRTDAVGGVKDLRDLVTQVRQFTEETEKVVTAVGDKIEPLDLASTQAKINTLLDNVNDLSERLKSVTDRLGSATESVSYEAGNIEYNLREGLRTLTQTLESIRDLIQYLKDNPSALIRGKGTPR